MNLPIITSPSLSKFEAYVRAVEAAKLAVAATAGWRGWGFLVDQVRRASTSVPLNLAEGNAFPFGSPKRRHHFDLAYGSALELESALELAATFGLGDASLHAARIAAGRSAAIVTKLTAPKR